MSTQPLNPLPPGQWGPDAARHLLNRAGFGVPRERVAELAELGLHKSILKLVYYDDKPSVTAPPDFVPDDGGIYELRRQMAGMSQEERQRAIQARQREERIAIERLKAWWLERMTNTPRPLEEKMALFWHGHFATSAQKVQSCRATYQLNDVFRRMATGNFKALTLAVGQSPSMIRYLDTQQNVKGKPNENWARELMELFTLGQGHYSEQDIKESARAFTGWAFGPEGFLYREELHDFGDKTFLGKRGNLDGWDVIDRIFEQPAAAEFICRKLWHYFAYEGPEDDVVRELADTLRAERFELRPVLHKILASQAFYSQRARGAQIKSPAQFVVQLAHDLRLNPPPYLAMARVAVQLGQDLFYPPNVKGWDGGKAWINANTLMARYNAPQFLIRASADLEAMLSERDMADAERMMAIGPNQERLERLRLYLESLPEDQRAEARQKIQAAQDPQQRRQIIDQLLRNAPIGDAWKPKDLFDGLPFRSAQECADALLRRYLAVEPAPERMAVIANALGGPHAPLTPETLDEPTAIAALHLLFSMAEYQVC